MEPSTPSSPYLLLGEAQGVRRLVDAFYDVMDQEPEVSTLRAMHAPSLRASRDKLFMFLSGWLGGPPLYIARFGHPRLRMRHLPFAIDQDASDQWMLCMRRALAQTVEDPALVAFLDERLKALAQHMINQPKPAPPG